MFGIELNVYSMIFIAIFATFGAVLVRLLGLAWRQFFAKCLSARATGDYDSMPKSPIWLMMLTIAIICLYSTSFTIGAYLVRINTATPPSRITIEAAQTPPSPAATK